MFDKERCQQNSARDLLIIFYVNVILLFYLQATLPSPFWLAPRCDFLDEYDINR